MKRQKILLLLFTTMMLLILAACADELPEISSDNTGIEDESVLETAMDDDETLIIGVSNNIDSMNPFNRGGLVSTYAQRFFYETWHVSKWRT